MSAGSKTDPDVIWTIIDGLDDDLKQLIKMSSACSAHIQNVAEEVHRLVAVVQTGNGRPGLVSQVETLKATLAALQSEVAANNGLSSGAVRATAERWKAAGKIAALIALAIPGILSFLEKLVRGG